MSPTAEPSRPRWTLAAVIAAGVAVRLVFLALADPRAVSIDLKAWSRVAWELEAGHNPYATTNLLNWPPLWVFVVWGLKKLSLATAIPFLRCVQVFLIAAEAVLVAATDRLMASLSIPGPERRRLLLFGFALNPIFVLLTCQHGNFDALPALAIVLFLTRLFRWLERGDGSDWLLGTLWLGLGVLAKTVPLVLAPLALAGSRRLSRRTLAAGATLVAGPAAAGVAFLYALDPASTLRYVIAYRSVPVGFGLPGALRAAGGELLVHRYGQVLPVLILAVLAGVAVACRRAWAPSRDALLLTALLLLVAIPLFGSGYGPQYIWWFWPLLLGAAARGSRAFRLAAGAFAGAAVVTYVVEYALVDYLGKLLLWTTRDPRLHAFGALVGRHLTIANAPLFLAYAALFAAGCAELGRLRRGAERAGPGSV